MSLINDMLKDLESREAKHIALPIIPLTTSTSSRDIWEIITTSIYTKIFISLCSIVLLSYVFITHSKHHSQLPPIAKTTTAPTTPSTTHTDETWLSPVSISGITIQVKDNITELSFLLNHPALYELKTDAMENQLTIRFENAALQSSLPTLNYLSTGIQSMTTEVNGNNTLFHLSLVPGAVIKFVNLNTDNGNSELVIDIQNDTSANKMQTTAAAIKSPVPQTLLTQQYQQAVSAAETGNYELAIQNLEYVIQANPSYNEARTSLAALLLDQGNAKRAKTIIDAGLALTPSYVPFIELKARLLSTAGNVDSALALLQTASPAISENPDYHAFIAALYERTNKNALAANIYRQLVDLNPSNGSWWFGLGISLEKLGHNKEASDAYTNALAKGNLNPESLAYLQNRLQTLKEKLNASE
jgi:Flp pilus assembly protein TadD